MATRIYVGNLPYNATNDQLAELFSQYGEVAEATVVMDRGTGRARALALSRWLPTRQRATPSPG